MSSTANTCEFSSACLEKHMRFICPECGTEHKSQQDWRNHLNVAHHYARKRVEDFDFKEVDDRHHECQVCYKWVANAHQAIALLQYHRFLHLPFPRTYRCRHCPGAFTRKRALCEHLTRFHGRLITRLERQRRLEWSTEAATVNDPKSNPEFYLRFICPQCGKPFDRFRFWQQHIDTVHNITSIDLQMHRIHDTKNYYCEQCKCILKNNPSRVELQRHHFKHLPYPLYFKCRYCNTKKCYKSEILRHFIMAHPQDFRDAKEYVRKPTEWGAVISAEVNKDLDKLLSRTTTPTKVKKTDLIQKALLDSLIDLEVESNDGSASKRPSNTSKSAHEDALDKSLNDLEAILRGDLEEEKAQAQAKAQAQESLITSNNSADTWLIPDEELEEICAEFFVEVEEKPVREYDDSTEPEEKIISLEINAVDTNDTSKDPPSFSSPKRKRIKLDAPIENYNEQLQCLMLQYIRYLCPECGCEFSEQPIWRAHVFNEHNLANAIEENFRPFKNKSSNLCLFCLQVQPTNKHSELRRHYFQHMRYQAYLKCTLCGKTKSSKPKMLQHMRFSHTQQLERTLLLRCASTLKCNDCGKDYNSEANWLTHRKHCVKRTNVLIRNYSIAENLRILSHLREAHTRIRKLAASGDN